MRTALTVPQKVSAPSDQTSGMLHLLNGRLRSGLAFMANLWPGVTAQMRQAFLQEVQDRALREGYSILKIDNGLIEMLLLKRQTRIVVMTSSRDLLSADHARLVMDLMQADAAWVLDRSALGALGAAEGAKPSLVKLVQLQQASAPRVAAAPAKGEKHVAAPSPACA